jgi:hypothetical protein
MHTNTHTHTLVAADGDTAVEVARIIIHTHTHTHTLVAADRDTAVEVV